MGALYMESFVEKITEAVKIHDVPISSSGGLSAVRSHESKDLEDLTDYLEDASHQRYACRVMYGSSAPFLPHSVLTYGGQFDMSTQFVETVANNGAHAGFHRAETRNQPFLLGAAVLLLHPESRAGRGLWRAFYDEHARLVAWSVPAMLHLVAQAYEC